MRTIALIPARSGSKRVPGKNIRNFCGHPLLAYAIQSAIDAEIFDGVYVSSDSQEILKVAFDYGAILIERPPELALDASPDAEWIEHAQSVIKPFDYFAIVRPTNPFRTGETIKRAWGEWVRCEYCMKAIEKASQHPYKMWVLNPAKDIMHNPQFSNSHLLPTQLLREIYIQNACLEFRPISKMDGKAPFYQPFFTKGYEGHDINTELDFMVAEMLVEKGLAKPPQIRRFSI